MSTGSVSQFHKRAMSVGYLRGIILYTCRFYGVRKGPLHIFASLRPFGHEHIKETPYCRVLLRTVMQLSAGDQPPACDFWSLDNVRTFDGLVYSFPSACRYSLLRDCRLYTFDVHVVTDPTCRTSTNETCPLSFEIYSGGATWAFKSVDGATVTTYNDDVQTLPVAKGPLVVELVSQYVVIKSTLGFDIWWDQQQHLQVKIALRLFKVANHSLPAASASATEFTMATGLK